MPEELTDTSAFAEISAEQPDTIGYGEMSVEQSMKIDREMVIEQIKVMQRRESETYLVEYYFPEDTYDSDSSGESVSQITPLWREKICEWAFQVVDHFDINRKVVAFAIKILDRYLAETKISTKEEFQLAATTALYFAFKTQEPRRVGIEAMAELSRGKFDSKRIAEEELKIMESLEYWLNPPLEDDYLLRFMKLINTNSSLGTPIYQNALFVTELSQHESFFITFPAASVAFAALVNAIERTYFDYYEYNHKRFRYTLKLDDDSKNQFYQNAAREFGLEIDSTEIVELRSRLHLVNETNTGA